MKTVSHNARPVQTRLGAVRAEAATRGKKLIMIVCAWPGIMTKEEYKLSVLLVTTRVKPVAPAHRVILVQIYAQKLLPILHASAQITVIMTMGALQLASRAHITVYPATFLVIDALPVLLLPIDPSQMLMGMPKMILVYVMMGTMTMGPRHKLANPAIIAARVVQTHYLVIHATW